MNNELIELTYVCKVCEASFTSDTCPYVYKFANHTDTIQCGVIQFSRIHIVGRVIFKHRPHIYTAC